MHQYTAGGMGNDGSSPGSMAAMNRTEAAKVKMEVIVINMESEMDVSTTSISRLRRLRIRPVGVTSCHRIVAPTIVSSNCLNKILDARKEPTYSMMRVAVVMKDMANPTPA